MKNEIEVLLPGFSMSTDRVSIGLSTVALIHTGAGPVLVDTGVPQTRRQLPERLAERGLSPEDIRWVLMTHLHWDHTGCVDLFPNATFVVGRAEWEYARTAHDPYYCPMALAALETSRLELIEGESVSLFAGICGLFAPGHTPGSYAYLADHASGSSLIAGDAVKNRGELGSRKLCLAVDPEQGHHSIQKLCSMCGHILPGHDVWCDLAEEGIIPGENTLNLIFPEGVTVNGAGRIPLRLDM